MSALVSHSLLKRRAGFSLLEMSLVLVIIAIVTGAALVLFGATLKNRQQDETNQKLATIQDALYKYRLAFNRLPCPGDMTTAITAQNYGIEGKPSGDCSGTGSVTPVATFINSDGNSTDPVGGMVPIKTLGLSDSYAYDGWGNKILYAVGKDLTASNGFASISANSTTTRMTVKDASGSNKSTTAAYVLVSFGADGFGAYPRNGGTTRLEPYGNLNYWGPYQTENYPDVKENCDCYADPNANVIVVTDFDGIFVQKAYSEHHAFLFDNFDDVVVFATRSDLRSAAE